MILLSIMYIPFLLMLRNESFFRFNRVVLLVIVVLSLVLPLCDVHFLSLNLLMAEEQGGGIVDVGIPVYVMDGVAVDEVAEALPEDEGFFSSVNWWAVVGWIYLIGMVVTILVKLVQLAMLYRTIHRGVLWTERKDGVRIYCHAGDITPFSWFNTIVISENDYEENAQVIIRHEMGHIVNYHSLDIILVNICEVIQWCNPLSWILVGSLRDVHEYEADDAVLASGVEVHRYQLLLIKKAVGSSSYAFANSFNHSLLKKRITMMINKKSNPWMRTKALYIIPVALVALSAFATPEFVAPIEEAVSELENRKVPVTSDIVNSLSSNDEKTEETTVGMPTPSLKDQYDLDEVLILIDGKVATKEELAKLPKDDYSVVVGYNVKAVREQLRALGLLKMVIFADNDIYVQKYGDKAKKAVVTIQSIEGRNNSKDDNFYLVSDMEPEFPGGKEELMKFVQNNLTYPEECLSNGIQGRVIVKFIVEADGTVTSPTIEQSVDHALDSVSLAMVKKMPKWRPALEDQKPVRREHSVPVTFRLQ